MAIDEEEQLCSATDFFTALFEGKPDGAAIQVWIRSTKSVTHFVNDIPTAVAISHQHCTVHDVYVGCGLGPCLHEKPLRTRLKADEVAGIPGVWADIDVNGGPEDKSHAAPNMDAALELASSLLEPTILVNSGYGLQAWWLFDEGPWIFESTSDREQAKRLVSGYQGALRAAARRLGWTLDAVQDLSRVLRVPGTFNHKGSEPAPTALIEFEGKRYNFQEIGEFGQGHSAVDTPTSRNGHDPLKVNHNAALDHRVTELIINEPDFLALWQRKTKLRDTSPSGYEWEISRWLCRAGLADQAVADALVKWRLSIDPDDSKNKLRADRLTLTIRKARNSVQKELDEEMEIIEREDAIERMKDVKRGYEEPNEAKVLAAFNRVIGGPPLARVKQFSRDPRYARFVIELDDGREIVLGKISQLLNQGQFAQQYGVLTGHLPKPVKNGEWHELIQGLMKIMLVTDERHDSSLGQMEEWLGDYLEMNETGDQDGACAALLPFTKNGGSYIYLNHFIRFLRVSLGERVEKAQIKADLRLAGFDTRKVNYTTPDGQRSSRMYWTNDLAPGRVGRPAEDE